MHTTLRQIFADIRKDGEYVSPRGEEVQELVDYKFTLQPYEKWMSFESRNLNIDYIRREFQWYVGGDLKDDRITKHAKIWKDLYQHDKTLHSNYGHYLFTQGALFNCVKLLSRDKDTRRACVTILNNKHLGSNHPDTPCTYGLNFRIRNNKLTMTVMMRSNDAVFGLGNDLPTFSWMHEIVYNACKGVYPDLEIGTYTHFANSLHVYKRHYDLADKIANGDTYVDLDTPKMTTEDALWFLKRNFNPKQSEFLQWLYEVEL